MITIKDLDYSYPGTRHKVFADFNLSISGNRIYGLLGKNGTGKSTLLYLISGLLRPSKGSEVTVDGLESRRREPEMLREMCLVAEEDTLPNVSLREFIKTYSKYYPRFSDEVLRQCLTDFDMPAGIASLHALSMGQRKKVTMSFALATGCRLLLMDEPTNGLDIPSKALFRKVVAKYMTDDRTMIVSTHQVHDIETLLDHIIIIDGSRVLMDSSVGDITRKYAFRNITTDEATAPDVLYSEPSPMGMAAILNRHDGDEETQMNLELLFDYVLNNSKSKIINPKL